MEGNAISTNLGSSSYSLVDLHRSPMRHTQPAGDAQGMVPGLIPVSPGIPQHTFPPLIPCKGRWAILASSLIK